MSFQTENIQLYYSYFGNMFLITNIHQNREKYELL